MTKKTHVHLADFTLDILVKRDVQYEAFKRSRSCMNSEQGADTSEATQMPVFSLAAIYAQFIKRTKAQQRSGDAPSTLQNTISKLSICSTEICLCRSNRW